ncbi:MAG: ThiF family adenylyltransferase [Desulfobacteraceae bacterium]|nr:ThiF family adenylyltransferase [Desulfobacteraceae bacterium]
MAKKKTKPRKKTQKKKSGSKPDLHPEAEYAFKTIQSHPAVFDRVNPPRPLNNGGFEIDLEMEVPMPARAMRGGASWTGVRAKEPILLLFPRTYPFNAPTILLRPDFNQSFPHINPIVRVKGQSRISPCVYDGPIDELLHQTGDGLSEILNRLVDWLGKAAINDLIEDSQGWEPIRRDETFGWVVYELSGLRKCVLDKSGALAFRCDIRELKNYDSLSYFVGGIDCQQPQSISPFVIDNTFTKRNSEWPAYGSLMLFVWPDKEQIADQYIPENVHNLLGLYDKARAFGCEKKLKSIFVELGISLKRSYLKRSVFYIPVILCARRPCKLINDDESLELIPYMAVCHAEERFQYGETAIKFREDSTVLPLGHRHAVTGKLLGQMSGGMDASGKGTIVHIGCGSVGSKIAMHLARAGHGPFQLIDNSAFSPHNAARHALIPIPDIPGLPKALFLAEYIKKLGADAEPHMKDFTEICQQSEDLKKIFQDDTRLVIDSTGSIAVRELLADLSSGKICERLLHAALYQGGETGLMAIEGGNQNPNLSDLIALFHDQRVEKRDFGATLQYSSDTMSRQDVGLGCGSHTMVMPDARVSLYSAAMAERARQILEGNADQNGELWIGMLDSSGFQVSWQKFKLGQTGILKVKVKNEWKIRILENALNQIEKEAEAYNDIETGGVLIGKISLSRRCITISRVIEAPPDSVRTRCSFVLGTEGLVAEVNEVRKKTDGYLNYVGTWHSHPKGGDASAVDWDCLAQMKKIRFGAPALGLIWTPEGYKAILDEGKLA